MIDKFERFCKIHLSIAWDKLFKNGPGKVNSEF